MEQSNLLNHRLFHLLKMEKFHDKFPHGSFQDEMSHFQYQHQLQVGDIVEVLYNYSTRSEPWEPTSTSFIFIEINTFIFHFFGGVQGNRIDNVSQCKDQQSLQKTIQPIWE